MKTKGPFYRSFEIEVRAINEKKRSVDLSFSSEIPALPRPWSEIPEILLHGEDNVDLSYLKTTGSVLMNHQPSGPGQPVVIVGKPTNVRLENRRGVATVIFDEDEKSDETFKKVISGSLRGVSVGAQIVRMVEVKAGDTLEGFAGPAYLATRWRPVEISLSPIPIDYSVGVNRSLSDMTQIQKTEDKIMTRKIGETQKPLIEDQNQRERFRALVRMARLIGGDEFVSRVVDVGFESGRIIDETQMAMEINNRLDEVQSGAKLHKSLNTPASSRFDLKDISNEEFFQALKDPLRHPVLTGTVTERVKAMNVKDFSEGLCNILL